MSKSVLDESRSDLLEDFQKEYNSDQSVRRYSTETAGEGITYLLDHDYGQLYVDVIRRYLSPVQTGGGLRLWEFGCGAGMNLLHLVPMLEKLGFGVSAAVGTDFAPSLIDAAQRDSLRKLSAAQQAAVRFCVARNECLLQDAAGALQTNASELAGSFHFVLGVNTMRYGHRLGNANECAQGIRELLAPGGVCIMIDMNRKFPAFRSRLRDALTKKIEAYYLPTLDEYARPFEAVGLEIVCQENFCWIPHSAGPRLLRTMRLLAPLLNAVLPGCAMRSLVVARKTA